MKQAPHIAASAVALFAALLAIAAFTTYSNLFEQKYVHSIAALDHQAIIKGSAMQRMAIKQDDLLLVIGGSEIVLLETKYQDYHFFSAYPTGFMVYDVANKGASALTMAQKLAALGGDLRGRKVVISITPAIITMAPYGEVNPDHYAANFSELHALNLAYSSILNMETKQLAAKRMLTFPETLKDKPLLKFALENLANGSIQNRILYSLSWPLGKLQTEIINLQDHYATVTFIRRRSSKELKITRNAHQIDWSALAAEAEQEQIQNTDSNAYAVDNLKWDQIAELFVKPTPAGSKDESFRRDVQSAREWQDLEIVLRTLKEMGAQPLILCRPMDVPLWEAIGVSEDAQNSFYKKLHEVVDPYKIPLVDYQQHGADKYFNMDLAGHTSRKGWIYVNQTLDEFFHGALR